MKPSLGYMVTVIQDGIIRSTVYDSQELALFEVKAAIESPNVIEVTIRISTNVKNGS